MSSNIIEVKGLKLAFQKQEVLKGVNFSVARGEIFALLGTNGAGAFAYPLMFLPFISSAFVPTESMPAAIRIFAENQPVTAIVDTIRALLENQPVGNDIWAALGWCLGILAVACMLAMRAYHRKTA